MPELPEVESTVRFLRERVSGDSIQSVKLLWPRTLVYRDKGSFEKSLSGCAISKVFRRGKFICFEIKDDSSHAQRMCIHLRMSGSIDVIATNLPPEKHDRLIITLTDKRTIRFHDPRKFGRVYLGRVADEVLSKLGREPLDKSLTADELHEIFKGKKGCLKPLLLNQALLVGLGNIYVDETLWMSGIHPKRSACSLKVSDWSLLLANARSILEEAILKQGTDFGDGVVDGGGYAPRAYGRTGEPCLVCGSAIRRIIVGQRGTHFCPKCQKMRKSQ